MKYFIVADVHGFYNEMIQALNEAGFDKDNSNHFFISLGDLMDRGSQPLECLQFVMSLDPNRRALVRGNHEDLIEAAIARGLFLSHDKTNGTLATALALTNSQYDFDALLRLRTHSLYNTYIHSLVDFYETKTGIFVHGWIPHYVEVKGFTMGHFRHDYEEGWRDASSKEWKDARWYNGMESWADGVREPNKTIYCGHWYAAWGRENIDKTVNYHNVTNADFKPWVKPGIVALDGCTALTHMVNVWVLNEIEGEIDENID